MKRVWSIAENHVLHGQAAAAHLWAVSNSHWTEVEIPRENHSIQIERSKLDTAAIGRNMLWHRLWQEGAEPGARRIHQAADGQRVPGRSALLRLPSARRSIENGPSLMGRIWPRFGVID